MVHTLLLWKLATGHLCPLALGESGKIVDFRVALAFPSDVGDDGEGAFDLSSPAQRLRSGDLVRVAEGPFENMLGRLLELADHERVYVLLELLGRSVRAEFAAAAVEAA